MKKFLPFLLVCFCLLNLYFPAGYSWGEDKKDPSRDQKASRESVSKAVKIEAQKEMEEVKQGAKEAGREIKESGKEFSEKAGKEFKKTGKALKETGKELKENVGEAWEDLKKQFKK